MKTIAFLFTLLGLLMQTHTQAQSKTPSTMKFEEKSWNFGNIKEADGDVSHTFVFTNTGADPFVIERVTTSCGCTTPEYTREPILPGRKGTIKVTFNPEGRPGPFQKTITITSHNSQNQNQLQITGTVIGRPRSPEEEYPVSISEGLRTTRQSCGLGYLPRGGTKSTTVEYMNDSPVSIRLDVAYKEKNDYFTVVFAPQTLPPGGKGVMTLSYDLREADLWGRLNDEFYLVINGKQTTPRFSATGIATEDYSSMSQQELDRAAKANFSSQYYHFGTLKAGTVRKRDFTITNNGSQPLKIQYLKKGPHTEITLNEGMTLAPGKSMTFTATLNTTGVASGRFMDNTVIILNDPLRPMREIRLAATIL